MTNEIIEATTNAYGAVTETQEVLVELGKQLKSTLHLLDKEFEKQNVQLAHAMETIALNEKYYRDTLHMTELSRGLSVQDKLDLFELLETAVSVRRQGKDFLTSLGLPVADVGALFTQKVGDIPRINPNKMPTIDNNYRAHAKVKKSITYMPLKLNKLSRTSENRIYNMRTNNGTLQANTITRFVLSRKKQKSKFKAIKFREGTV